MGGRRRRVRREGQRCRERVWRKAEGEGVGGEDHRELVLVCVSYEEGMVGGFVSVVSRRGLSSVVMDVAILGDVGCGFSFLGVES